MQTFANNDKHNVFAKITSDKPNRKPLVSGRDTHSSQIADAHSGRDQYTDDGNL